MDFRKTTRRRRVLGVCVLAGLVATWAAMPAQASSAPALGRTVALSLVRQPAPRGFGQVFAYGPASGGFDTNSPQSMGGQTVWKGQLSGTSALRSSSAGVTFAPSGSLVGYAFDKPAATRLLGIYNKGTMVVSNLSAGGATWEWSDSSGMQYLNHYDMGRELQGSFFMHRSDGQLVNPNEAGDLYGYPAIPQDQRHTSPTAYAKNLSASHQKTLAVPLEWWPEIIDPAGGPAHPVVYSDVRIGKDLQLNYNGWRNVARYDTLLQLPGAAQGASLEAPTAYLRPMFSNIVGYDAKTGATQSMAPRSLDTVGINWTPGSGWGAIIASDDGGRHAFAIYGVLQSQGGSITNFTAHDFRVNDGTGAGDFSSIKLRAERMGDFPAGLTTSTAYIITGTLDSVKSQVAALAANGVK